MRFLVVEDDGDVLELTILFIQMKYPDAVCVPATDGKEAIEKIRAQAPFDIIFSDFNMPRMNGAVFFLELRKIYPTLPFVLISSELLNKHPEFKNDKHFRQIEKPYTDKEVHEAIEFYSQTKPALAEAVAEAEENYASQAFIPVDISLLLRMGRIEVPLFLKISDQKVVKSSHGDRVFDQAEYERFKSKDVQHLLIDHLDFDKFISSYQKQVFATSLWNGLDDAEATRVLTVDLEMIQKASQVFGWSTVTMNIANKNIQRVLHLVDKNPRFKRVSDIFRDAKNKRLVTHSVMLTYLMSECAKTLNWSSELTLQKLAFAATLHDMDLDESFFNIKADLMSKRNIKDATQDPDIAKLFNHVMGASQLVLNWSSCPPDVDVIIRQHHEKPDGSGFPLGLEDSKISPLAALFILAEDVIYHGLEDSKIQPQAYLISREDYYSREPFKAIYKAMLKTVSD